MRVQTLVNEPSCIAYLSLPLQDDIESNKFNIGSVTQYDLEDTRIGSGLYEIIRRPFGTHSVRVELILNCPELFVMSDTFSELVDGPKAFAEDSAELLRRCRKPDRKGTVYKLERVLLFQTLRHVSLPMRAYRLTWSLCRILSNY